MKKVLMTLVLSLMLGLLLAGCDSAGRQDPTGAVQDEQVTGSAQEISGSTAVVQEPSDTREPTEESTPTETSTPTVEPSPTVTPVVVVDVDSACVDCHSDTERLKELAKEPEKVELSSGEG